MNRWVFVRLAVVLYAFLRPALSGADAATLDDIGGFPPWLMGVFGIVGMLFIIGMQRINRRSAPAWRYPSWRINPFLLRQPLQFFHLGGFFLVASGAGSIVADLRHGHGVTDAALAFFSFGAGILAGVHACTLVYRGKMVADPDDPRR